MKKRTFPLAGWMVTPLKISSKKTKQRFQNYRMKKRKPQAHDRSRGPWRTIYRSVSSHGQRRPAFYSHPTGVYAADERNAANRWRHDGRLSRNVYPLVNTNHELVGQILQTKTAKKRERLIQQALDLARLSQNLLKGEALTTFIRRSVDLIK